MQSPDSDAETEPVVYSDGEDENENDDEGEVDSFTEQRVERAKGMDTKPPTMEIESCSTADGRRISFQLNKGQFDKLGGTGPGQWRHSGGRVGGSTG